MFSLLRLLQPVAQISSAIRQVSSKTKTRQEFRDSLTVLYNKRSNTTTPKGWAKYSRKIDQSVISFNEKVLRKKSVFDMHGMTPKGAVDYLLQQIHETTEKRDLILITGSGNNSKNGKAAIRDNLIRRGKDLADSKISMDRKNPGMLRVTIKKKA